MGLPRLRRQPGNQAKFPRPSLVGAVGEPFDGVDLHNQSVTVELGAGPKILLFLTTSCQTCLPLWHQAAQSTPGELTIVTPSPSTESRRKAANLAGSSTVVVMSSEAWHRYRVTGAPWRIVFDGSRIISDGPAGDP